MLALFSVSAWCTFGTLGCTAPPPPSTIAEFEAESHARSIDQAAQFYAKDTGRFPSGVQVLVPDYLGTALPNDPWGRPYQAAIQNSSVTVSSFGADGLQGGTGANADISSTCNQ